MQGRKNFLKESLLYYIVKIFGYFLRRLPFNVVLFVGKCIGIFGYYFDSKHRAQAYANLKMAFAATKSPREIRKITKDLFINYGCNFVELFRMPLMNETNISDYVHLEGKQYAIDALKKRKGLILLAMHFGSWELGSLSTAMLNHPYKVFVKPQTKYSKLDNLLNSYRECGGSIVLSRGLGTRELVTSLLKHNEIVGMVVDQGGKDGVLVPFYGRQASMSVGAVKLGLKWGIPICFAVIIREKGNRLRCIIHKSFDLIHSGDLDKDIFENLSKITKLMEHYTSLYPSEYMWFYKIWKYSKETHISILADDKIGHTHQSQAVAKMINVALEKRKIKPTTHIIPVEFKSKLFSNLFNLLVCLTPASIYQGRLGFLKVFLTANSYRQLMSVKADFVISCGSSIAGINRLLARDHKAKSIHILKPGFLGFKKFDIVFLPQHDVSQEIKRYSNVITTYSAPNLIDDPYLLEQSQKFLSRFSHLKQRMKIMIGVLIGGNTKHVYISEDQIRIFVNQIKEVSQQINADIILTTSRRTPPELEIFILKELKKFSHCPVCIIANRENIPEAMGGILALSDILVVSGDSISMVSEAASAGKNTIVFSPQKRSIMTTEKNKHMRFIHKLSAQGYIFSTDVNNIGRTISDVSKNKIQTKKLNDDPTILEAVRRII